MTKLTTIEGGLSKATSHIYEVHNSEGDIVDVLRFDTPEDVIEFQSAIVGDYTVKPHTLSVEELLDEVLDMRIYEMSVVNRHMGCELVTSDEVASLVEKIKRLPEFQAKFKPSNTTIFGISVLSRESLSGDDAVINFKTNEIEIYEELGGERIGGKFAYNEELGFSYRNKDIDESEVLQKIQTSMQKFAGIPINGYFQTE